jgi:hypothetical protein
MRPFYVIGHNTGTIANIDEVLAAGANAVEPDIQYVERTDKLHISNEDVLGPTVEEFFIEMGQRARNSGRRALRKYPFLIILDCKRSTVRPRNGARLLRYARQGLAGTPIHIIMSVASLDMTALFEDITDQLGPREALMVDQSHHAGAVCDYFHARGVKRACYGDNRFARPIDHGMALKVQGRLGYVYTYTLSDVAHMRDFMRTGVDGIIVGDWQIAELRRILEEPEFKERLSLATQDDDPLYNPGGYTISLKTLDRSIAGTDANVTITLHGDQSTLHARIAGDRLHRFEAGILDEVSIYGDIGVPRSITLEHDGAGADSRWLPDIAHVRRTGDPTLYGAGLGAWVEVGRPTNRTLGSTRYALFVQTSDVSNAGTDANLVFTVHGPAGEVTRRVLASSRPFERGMIDDVYLYGPDVGEVTAVSVYNAGQGSAPAWHVERIVVRKDDDAAFELVFARWIAAGETQTVAY